MNIVVVGGGQPGKFGNDVVLRARSQGHRVLVISHQPYQDPDLAVADFGQVASVIDAFKTVTAGIDTVDLMLYNSNCASYPNKTADFNSTAIVNEERYFDALRIHAVIPHAVTVECSKKMQAGGRVVYMSSWSALNFKNSDWADNVGYAGGKAYQTRLMMAFAKHNDRGLICSAVYPHFDYADKEKYQGVFDQVYNYMTTHDKSYNGKIVGISDANKINIFN